MWKHLSHLSLKYLMKSRLHFWSFISLLSCYFQVREAHWTKTKRSKVTCWKTGETCCLISEISVLLTSKTKGWKCCPEIHLHLIFMSGSHWVVIPNPMGRTKKGGYMGWSASWMGHYCCQLKWSLKESCMRHYCYLNLAIHLEINSYWKTGKW